MFVFSKQKCDKQIYEALYCLYKRIRKTTQSEIKGIKLIADFPDYFTYPIVQQYLYQRAKEYMQE